MCNEIIDNIENKEEEYISVRLEHSDYFVQFEEVIRERLSENSGITLYRTCQNLPLTEDDKLARIFRKKEGGNPVYPIYSEEELNELEFEKKFKLVTKGALSFNTTPEAAERIAKEWDEKLRKEKKGGKRKSASFRKERGHFIGKFDFPEGIGLVTPEQNEHLNLLTYKCVDIEQYRDKSYVNEFEYDEYDEQ